VRLAALAAVAIVLAGCATSAQSRGRNALEQGDYTTALSEFQAALAEHPDRLDALLGLGIAQYKTGAFAEAESTLEQVLARAPQSGAALLYGGLAALQQGHDGVAEEWLTKFRAVESDPRFGQQVDRALRLLRGGDPVDEEVRQFIAMSLEDSARAARDVRAAQLEAQRARSLSSYPYPVRCYPTRRGGLVCL